MTKKISKKLINLYLAGPRGFCAGVDRAILMVEEAIKKFGKPVYVRHEIVHNKIVVDDLQLKGAIFVNELNEIKDKNRPVIFSAHGVPKSVPEEAKFLNLQYYDATCPLVSKIHREVENFEKLNLPIILIGHHNHPEVIGTMGQVNSKIYLIENLNDIEKLDIAVDQKIAYVTQTTLSIDDTKLIIETLKKKYKNVVEPKKNDICYATTNRQNAVKEIAKFCDLFIVIGAKNSSNSIRLVEVANQYKAKKSMLLESNKNFDISLLEKVKSVGITASASAPEKLVLDLIKNIKETYDIKLHQNVYQKENVHFNIPNQLRSIN